MANLDTVKAIKANLKAIIVAQGFNYRDSSSDPTVETTPLASLHFRGEDFENAYGQKPVYNTLNYEIVANFNTPVHDTADDKAAEHGHKLRENITVNALNTGGLASSKLVARVFHQGYDADYNRPVITVTYRLKITYREQ